MKKNFIITDKGRDNGITDTSIIREIDRIVCRTEYDYYGQSSLYGSSYFQGNRLVGVTISGREEEVDWFADQYIELGYLKQVL